jgi:hypothetical protein
MQKIDWRKFYGDEPSQPIPIEKYFLDDGKDGHGLDTRQMTYEFCTSEYVENKEGMYPTFEVNDIVIDKYGKGHVYHIFEYERGFQELHVELLDENMRLTGKTTYLDVCEVFHKLKDAEWI